MSYPIVRNFFCIFFVLFVTSCTDIEDDVELVPMPSVLRVGQWNVMMFGINGNVYGMSDEVYSRGISEIDSILTEINADILFLNEYNDFLDVKKLHNTYETLFKKKYSFFAKSFNGCAILSTFPLRIEERVFGSRRFLVGVIRFQKQEIGISCIHPVPNFTEYSQDERIDDHKQIVNIMKDYNNVIVAGDFNTLDSFELEPYRQARYYLCNWGNEGEIVTWPERRWALDNIVVKGLSVESYHVIPFTSVADHYPTYAIITTGEVHEKENN